MSKLIAVILIVFGITSIGSAQDKPSIDKPARFHLDFSIDEKPIDDYSKVTFTLQIGKDFYPLNITNDSLTISFFKDSALLVLSYGKIKYLSTTYYWFMELLMIKNIAIDVMTKKKMRKNKEFRHDRLVYTIREYNFLNQMGRYQLVEVLK